MKTTNTAIHLGSLSDRIEGGASSLNVAEKILEVTGWLTEHPSIAAIAVIAILSVVIWATSKLHRKNPPEEYIIEVVRRKWVLRSVGGAVLGSGGSKKSMILLARQCLVGRSCNVHVRNTDGSDDHTFNP